MGIVLEHGVLRVIAQPTAKIMEGVKLNIIDQDTVLSLTTAEKKH